MHENEKKALSNARFEHANECLTAAQSLLDSSNYKVQQIAHTMQYFMQ